MEKKFFKRLVLLTICLALVSTQIFAETEKIPHLTHSENVHDDHGLNCIGDAGHYHYSDQNNENSSAFNQENLTLISQNGLLAGNSDIIKTNQDKLLSSQIAFFQNNVLNASVLEDQIFEYELFFAAQLMKKDMADISYNSIVYDLDNRPLYYLVEFSSGGYAIILRTHNVPIEMSYTSKGSPYSKNNEAKKYYIGMLSYAIMSNGQIVSLLTKKALSQDNIVASKKANTLLLNKVDNDYKQKSRQTTSLKQSDIQSLYMQGTIGIKVQDNEPVVEVPNATYFSNDAPFGYNVDGDCGPTAAAMLMRYYDDNINSDFIDIPDLKREHVDDAWRDIIKSYRSTEIENGTLGVDDEYKLNVYFGVNKPNLYYRAHSTFVSPVSKATNLITSGKPVVLYGVLDLPAFNVHAVLAYGFKTIQVEELSHTMFKVNTGWHPSSDGVPGCPYAGLDANGKFKCSGGKRDDVWINSYILYDILWIDKIPSSHIHDFTYSSDAGGHQLICSCGLKKIKENHTSILDKDTSYHFEVCKYCNYVFNDCNGFITPATCTEPRKCKTCYKTFGEYLGHSYSPATCISPIKCKVCDATLGASLGHDYSIATCTIASKCSRCGVIAGTSLGHDYSVATCTTASKCSRCGVTTGTSLGHDYSVATCTTTSKCSRCGVTTGTSLGHDYSAATCTVASKCSRCGATTGTPLGHNYSAATCTAASKCSRCGATAGTSLGHNYSVATCTTASKCSRCGTTTGTSLGHNYSAATCTTASKCTRCGVTTGTSLGHNYSAATCISPKRCSRCGATTGTALGHVWSYGTCNYKFCDMCGTSSGSTTHNWVSGTCTYKSCSKCGSSSGTSTHSYNAATCMLPKTCRNCGATSGTKLGHNFVNGKCTRCPVSVNRIKEYE